MIKIAQQPEFWTDVTFYAPGGNEVGSARTKWRAVSRSGYNDLMKLPADEIIRSTLVGWEGIEDEFNVENVNRLIDLIPSAARSLLDAFTRGLFAAERGN
jgi:hypothetical protein